MTHEPNQPSRRSILRTGAALAAAAAFGPLACSSSKSTTEVVLYTSVDEPIAKQVVTAFEKANPSVKVRLVTDTEASKSVGLAVRLRAEKASPICHVWWGNEVFHTIALANEGFFTPLSVPVTNEILPRYRDPQDRWAGVGLRVRVMAVGENVGEVKGSLDDLFDPRFKGKVAIASPLAGTTGGHISALYALWGDTKADEYFRKLKANGCLMLGGNSDVAEQVGKGTIAVGLTDSDDVIAAGNAGGELWLQPLEQGEQDIGTLAIPTTVALINRPDAPSAARALAAFLLASENETQLSDEKFTAYSVRAGSPAKLKTMNVKFDEVAMLMAKAPARVVEILQGRA